MAFCGRHVKISSRKSKIMKTTFSAAIGAFALALCLAIPAGAANPTLDIYWIDSEGGGSTLIVTPAGESILVDSGNPGGRDPGRA